MPEYLSEVNIEILVETPGVNNSGAPYEVCLNSNVASKGSIGSTVANKFAINACKSRICIDEHQLILRDSQLHTRPPAVASTGHNPHAHRRNRHAAAMQLRNRRAGLLHFLRSVQRGTSLPKKKQTPIPPVHY